MFYYCLNSKTFTTKVDLFLTHKKHGNTLPSIDMGPHISCERIFQWLFKAPYVHATT